MSAHPGTQGQAPGYRAIRWNMDWILRPLFGLIMAGAAIFSLVHGPRTFALLTAAIAVGAAFEWHRLVSKGQAYRLEASLTGVILVIACVALSMKVAPIWPFAVLAAGVLASAVLASIRGHAVGWNAFGVLYLGLPSLSLVALRTFPRNSDAFWMVAGLFLIVWATDTGALICGNLIGGPRLAPVLSPSKTWAGTIGGSLTGAFVFACVMAAIPGGSFLLCFLFAFLLSFVAHAGDLFESFVKRRFGFKDSGMLIPGHGGILDRMDSTLAAAPVLALLVFVFHFSPLIGVHA
jgi:phosphatidate cytidylyltransferase